MRCRFSGACAASGAASEAGEIPAPASKQGRKTREPISDAVPARDVGESPSRMFSLASLVASAQWNPAALIPVVLGVLLIRFSSRLGRGAQGISPAWSRIFGQSNFEKVERLANSEKRAQAEGGIVAIGGALFVAAGLGLFFGILPSD